MGKAQYRYSPALGKRIAVEVVAPKAPTRAGRKRKQFKARFIQVPSYWIRQLEQYNSAALYQLSHRVLREDHKRRQLGGGEIILSTEVTGLTRQTRSWAIKIMVKAKMIEISQCGNQAARVVRLLHNCSN